MSQEIANIEVSALSKRYGSLKAVQDLSFRVGRGEVVGFLGPNGAGKSTTMRILAGIVPACSGVARICGMPVSTHRDQIKPRLGYMPESNPLPEEMRVEEYLRFRARLKEVPRKELRERVEWAMQTCDLDRKARRKIIGNLSKGFRQRVGIADAIIGKPDVIIMDEPTIGLDPHQILAIRELINSLRGQMTVVISSHILAEVEQCCDRVIIINRGYLVASGTLPELRKEFIHEQSYELRTAIAPETLENALKEIDADMRIVSCEYDLEYAYTTYKLATKKPGDQSSLLIKELPKRDIPLHGVQLHHPSLEDIFLAATQRSWEQEMETGVRPTTPPEKVVVAAETKGEPSAETESKEEAAES